MSSRTSCLSFALVAMATLVAARPTEAYHRHRIGTGVGLVTRLDYYGQVYPHYTDEYLPPPSYFYPFAPARPRPDPEYGFAPPLPPPCRYFVRDDCGRPKPVLPQYWEDDEQ